MSGEQLLYEKVYHILKNKIECGALAGGEQLPSRAALCREFGASEKTIRRALNMLSKEGLIQTEQRRRPTVSPLAGEKQREARQTVQKAEASPADSLLKTGILLCYPLNGHGMALCTGEDWAIPLGILGHMDPDRPTEFWRLSNRLWRFFIARCGNQLLLETVDSLGFSQVDPMPGTRQTRVRYLAELHRLLETVRLGGTPAKAHFDDLFPLYDVLSDKVRAKAFSPRPAPLGAAEGEARRAPRLDRAQERYLEVYLDLLGLIAVGRYDADERLPSHSELCAIYGERMDTTVKAVKMLEEQGAVTARRGRGIFVCHAPEGLKLDRELAARPVRRFLDTLELLWLTVQGVAFHTAQSITAEDARFLYRKIDHLWNGEYTYQLAPAALLEFLTDHIPYPELRTVYRAVEENYRIGRSIPELVNRKKAPAGTHIYRLCISAAGLLVEGQAEAFAQKAADAFETVRQLVISECRRLGYWEPAMALYDGSLLWK